MRRSFDGLSMLAEHVMGCNHYAGHLVLFSNRRTDRVKILYWDRDGWAIWYKRLARSPLIAPAQNASDGASPHAG
jgi:transposase